MAITFFDLNGSGTGGGGGSTVNTANGIVGDGSLVTPVELGGSLIQNTIITLAAFILSLQGTNMTVNIGGIDYFLTISNSGYQNKIEQKNDGVTVDSILLSVINPGVSEKRLLIDAFKVGLRISDLINNVGLIGETLFPNSNANQYVQAGNLPSLTGNSGNGLSGNGTVANPFILGGALTALNTIITSGVNSFQLTLNNSAIQDGIVLTSASTIISYHDISAASNTENRSFIFCRPASTALQSNGSTAEARSAFFDTILVPGVSVQCVMQLTQPGGLRAIAINSNTNNGIVVTDTFNNIGLFGAALFTLSSPNQYVQAGNLPQKANADLLNQSATFTIVSFTTTVNSIIRVNSYAEYISGAGSVAITITYTSVHNGVKTINVGTAVSSVNVVSAYAPSVFKAVSATSVSIIATVTGAINFDAGGTIEVLKP